jgi:hypothetical protein
VMSAACYYPRLYVVPRTTLNVHISASSMHCTVIGKFVTQSYLADLWIVQPYSVLLPTDLQ